MDLTGNLKLSSDKEKFVQNEVAYHFGQMPCVFLPKDLSEVDVETADKTHLVINLDDSRT